MTSVPKPLKFLAPHWVALKEYYPKLVGLAAIFTCLSASHHIPVSLNVYAGEWVRQLQSLCRHPFCAGYDDGNGRHRPRIAQVSARPVYDKFFHQCLVLRAV
jgi:hypothetical protein